MECAPAGRTSITKSLTPPEPPSTPVLEMLQIAVQRSYGSAEATGHEVLSNGVVALVRGKAVSIGNADKISG